MRGSGVVVTGAGHGIGRALATRLAAEGARVVVNDLDADAARAVADEIGGYAAPGDAASEAGVDALVEAAREHLGAIDVCFANAGVDRGVAACDAPTEDWAAAHRGQRDGPRPRRPAAGAGWLERGRRPVRGDRVGGRAC